MTELWQAAILNNRWRQQLRCVIDANQLDPATALDALIQLTGEEHRKGYDAVLSGFRAYSPRSSAPSGSIAIASGPRSGWSNGSPP